MSILHRFLAQKTSPEVELEKPIPEPIPELREYLANYQDPPSFDPEKDQPDPIFGETCWFFYKDAGTPWPSLTPYPIEILGVRDGYVRHGYADSCIFSPSVTPLKSFKRRFRKVPT